MDFRKKRENEISKMTSKPRKNLNIFYILDTSGSMEGEKIAAVNVAMSQSLQALKECQKVNDQAVLRISIMRYDTEAEWVTSRGPASVDEFVMPNLKIKEYPDKLPPLTEMGKMLEALDKKLSRGEWLGRMEGAYKPVIIVMTDGYPTDGELENGKVTGEFGEQLKNIWKNEWFENATKIGFAIGDGADKEVIAKIVGDTNAVIKTNDLDKFIDLLNLVSVRASQIVTHRVNENVTGDDVLNNGGKDGKKERTDVMIGGEAGKRRTGEIPKPKLTKPEIISDIDDFISEYES